MAKPEVDVQVKLLFQNAVKELSNALDKAASNIKVGLSVADDDLKRTIAHIQKFFNEKETLQLFTKDSKVNERDLAAYATKAIDMFDKVIKNKPAVAVQFQADMADVKSQVEKFMLYMDNNMPDRAKKVAEQMMGGIPSLFSRLNTAIQSSGLTEKLKEAEVEIKKMVKASNDSLTDFENKFASVQSALQGASFDFGDKARAEQLLGVLDKYKEKFAAGDISAKTFNAAITQIGGKLAKLQVPPELTQAFQDMQGIGKVVDPQDIANVEAISERMKELGNIRLDATVFDNFKRKIAEIDVAVGESKGGKALTNAFHEATIAIVDFQEKGIGSIEEINAKLATFEQVADKAGVAFSSIDTSGVLDPLKKSMMENGDNVGAMARSIAQDVMDATVAMSNVMPPDSEPPKVLMEIIDTLRRIQTEGAMTKEEIERILAIKGTKIDLSITGDIQGQLDGASGALEEVRQAVDKIDITRTLDPSAVIEMRGRFVELSTQLEDVREKSRSVGAQIAEMMDKAMSQGGMLSDEDTKIYDSLIAKQQQYGKNVGELREQFRNLHSEVGKFRSALGTLDAMQDKLGGINTAMRDLNMMGVPIPRAIATSVGYANVALMGMQKVITGITISSKKMAIAEEAKKAAASFKDLAENMAGVNPEEFEKGMKDVWANSFAEAEKLAKEKGLDLGDAFGQTFQQNASKYVEEVLKNSNASEDEKRQFTEAVSNQAVTSGQAGGTNIAKGGINPSAVARTGVMAGALLLIAGVNEFWNLYEKRREEASKREILANKQLSEMRIQAIQHESQVRIRALEAEFDVEKLRDRNREKMAADSLTMNRADLAGQMRIMEIEERRRKGQKDAEILMEKSRQGREKVEKQMEHTRQQQAARREGLHGDSGITTGAALTGAGAGMIAAGASGLVTAAGAAMMGGKIGAVLGTSAGPIGTAIGLAAGAAIGASIGLAVAGIAGDLLPKLRSGQGHEFSSEVSASVRSWHGLSIDKTKLAKFQADMEAFDNMMNAQMDAKLQEMTKAFDSALDAITAGDWEIPPSIKERLEKAIEDRNKGLMDWAQSTETQTAMMWEGGAHAAIKRMKDSGAYDEKSGLYTFRDTEGKEMRLTYDKVIQYYADNRTKIEEATRVSQEADAARKKRDEERIKAEKEIADREKQVQAVRKARIDLEIQVEKELRDKLQQLSEQAATSVGDWKDFSGSSQWEESQMRLFDAQQAAQMSIAKLQGKDAENRMKTQQAQDRALFQARTKHEAEFQKERFELEIRLAEESYRNALQHEVEYNKLRRDNEVKVFETVVANRKREREMLQRTIDRQLEKSLVTADTYGKSRFDVERDILLIEIADKYDRIITQLENTQARKEINAVAKEDKRHLDEMQYLQDLQLKEQADLERDLVMAKHKMEMQMMAIRFMIALKQIEAEEQHRRNVQKALDEKKGAIDNIWGQAAKRVYMDGDRAKDGIDWERSIRDVLGDARLVEIGSDITRITEREWAEIGRKMEARADVATQDLASSIAEQFRLTGGKEGLELKDAMELASKDFAAFVKAGEKAQEYFTQRSKQTVQVQENSTKELSDGDLDKLRRSAIRSIDDAMKEDVGYILNYESDRVKRFKGLMKERLAGIVEVSDDALEELYESFRKERTTWEYNFQPGGIGQRISQTAAGQDALDEFTQRVVSDHDTSEQHDSSEQQNGYTQEMKDADDARARQAKESLEAMKEVNQAIEEVEKVGGLDTELAIESNEIARATLRAILNLKEDEELPKGLDELLNKNSRDLAMRINEDSMRKEKMKADQQKALDDLASKQRIESLRSKDARDARAESERKAAERAKKAAEERAKLEAERKKREEKLNADLIKIFGQGRRNAASIDTDFAISMAQVQSGSDWTNAVQTRQREQQYNAQMMQLDARHRMEQERLEAQYAGRGVPEEVRAMMAERQADEKAQIDNNKKLAEAVANSMQEVGTYRGLVDESAGQKSGMEDTWERIQASAFGMVHDPAADAVTTMNRDMKLQHANLMTALTMYLPQLVAGQMKGGTVELPQTLINALSGRNQAIQHTHNMVQNISNNIRNGLADGYNGSR